MCLAVVSMVAGFSQIRSQLLTTIVLLVVHTENIGINSLVGYI